jgi:hypothetical protein
MNITVEDCMGFKLDLSQLGKHLEIETVNIGCSGKYVELTWKKQQDEERTAERRASCFLAK